MMKWSFEDEFRCIVFFLKSCGILPLESCSTFMNSMISTCSVIAILFLVLPELYGLSNFSEKIDSNERILIITVFEETSLTLGKLIVMIFKREQILRLLNCCKILWQAVKYEIELEKMGLFLKQARYLAYGCAFHAVIGITTVLITPLFIENGHEKNGTKFTRKWLPFPIGLVIEDQVVYYIWYALQVPASLLALCAVIAVHTGIPVLFSYTVGHMKLVQFWLYNIAKCQAVKKNATSVIGFSETDQARQKFLKCIKHHQRIIRYEGSVACYCKELEDALNYVTLFQTIITLTNSALIGATLLRDNSWMIIHGMHLMGTIGRLLMFFWLADEINTESFAVARAVYSVPWCSWPLSDRKLILFAMMMTQKPASLTAGKFAVMSLPNFSGIMSKAASFYTVLRATT